MWVGRTVLVSCMNYTPQTRPIAHSTKATSDWLVYLKNESNSWEEMLAKADGSSQEYIKDLEAVEVIKAYMKHKCKFEDVYFA